MPQQSKANINLKFNANVFVPCTEAINHYSTDRLSRSFCKFHFNVRKKETRDRAVQTMPTRVLQGAADFEETLFVKCHLYGNSSGSGKQFKFEPRPFWIYVIVVDADELDFGRSSVDLSLLIQESMEKSAFKKHQTLTLES
ncbi:hypothetical protein NE237_006025 [Protea cynaroides]|uniref:C2 NT-type domain-containing protein n=1 Tax=Protea cynaroides TaxID=273540 RepID=A0A9Q0KLS3_9MAGN|nr:hypothetical protein NE237_006025 [Protea cynaroides]